MTLATLSQHEKDQRLITLLSEWDADEAALDAQLEELNAILEAGANPDAYDAEGMPAMILAARTSPAKNSVKLMSSLQEHGADPAIKERKKGRNAYFYVGGTPAPHWLMTQGVDMLEPDAEGRTASVWRNTSIFSNSGNPHNLHESCYADFIVDAYSFIEENVKSNQLTYELWLIKLSDVARQAAEHVADQDPEIAMSFYWKECFPHAIRRCAEMGRLTREDIVDPEKFANLVSATSNTADIVQAMQEGCLALGEPLTVKEIVSSRLAEVLAAENNAHLLFSYGHWKDRTWPEIKELLDELPANLVKSALDGSHFNVFVPHVRRWLDSDDIQAMTWEELGDKLTEVPSKILNAACARGEMVARRQMETADAGVLTR